MLPPFTSITYSPKYFILVLIPKYFYKKEFKPQFFPIHAWLKKIKEKPKSLINCSIKN